MALTVLPAMAAQTGDGPATVGGSVTAPVVMHQVDPEYPKGGIFHGKKSSAVTLSLIVDKDGMPQNIEVEKSGGTEFDRSAIKAVSQYRFKPSMKEGTPAAVKIRIEVNFQVTHK